MTSRRASALLLAGLILALMVPATASAAATTLYVDGKTGNDGNTGLSATTAFKTIAKASSKIPAGSAPGWTVIVKGYTDYIYRERPVSTAFASYGSSGAHITWKATGYVAGTSANYVKPIVSGSDVAPAAGQSWTASNYAGVWKTPWTTEPYFFGRLTGSIKSAIFQNGTTWLWEQTSASAVATRAKTGLGGFWWDKNAKVLYVSAVAAGSASKSPVNHKIDVIVRPTFYFKGDQGVKYVDVRGFDVRHSANGIAFDNGTDYSVAADNVLTGNFLMGLTTAGVQTASGPNPATGNNMSRNRGSRNTLQLIKVDEGSMNTIVCDNTAWDNAMRGILVQGRAAGTGYTGLSSGVTVCRNKLYGHDYNPSGSVYNNASGITVANGAQKVTLDSNESYANDVGIHVTQERSGLPAMEGIVLRYNSAHDNRRFGLNLYDGVYGTGGGHLTATKDTYWGNGTGVMVSRASTNKTLSQVTIHDNDADGIRVGESGNPAAKLTVTKSLVTSNGGYGLWLVTGSYTTLSYVGFAGNASGSIKGTPSKTGVNTQAAGYLSTTPSNANYLKISTSSYQYTAGPSHTPIGARY